MSESKGLRFEPMVLQTPRPRFPDCHSFCEWLVTLADKVKRIMKKDMNMNRYVEIENTARGRVRRPGGPQ